MSDGPAAGPWPGFFVSIEGVDGAGKSTQVAALGAALSNDGHEVVTVREPGETAVGESVRNLVLHQRYVSPLTPWAEALLFVAARAQLLQEIVLPALRRGAVVLADRFVDSFIAYQGGGRGLPVPALRRLHLDACGGVVPDLTLLLDLPLEDAERRRRATELPLDRMEAAAADFHRRVHGTFRALAEEDPARIVVVDAGRPAVAVSERVWDVVAGRLVAGAAPAASPRARA